MYLNYCFVFFLCKSRSKSSGYLHNEARNKKLIKLAKTKKMVELLEEYRSMSETLG